MSQLQLQARHSACSCHCRGPLQLPGISVQPQRVQRIQSWQSQAATPTAGTYVGQTAALRTCRCQLGQSLHVMQHTLKEIAAWQGSETCKKAPADVRSGQADLEMWDRKSRPSSSSSTLRGAPVLALSTSFVLLTWEHTAGISGPPACVVPSREACPGMTRGRLMQCGV